MVDWSDDELRASVVAYRAMQRAREAGEKINKTEVYRQLSKRYGRTPKAFDYRMQNISAVLQDLKEEWLPGLKPATNVGPTVREKLIALLKTSTPRSSSGYEVRLPAMRARLISVARAGARITYGELMREFDLNRFVLRHAMARLGWQAREQGEPIITAVIVNAHTGRCSPGLGKEFGVTDDDVERSRLYTYWKTGVQSRIVTRPSDGTLKSRAKRFATVEVRPDQRAFRERVFTAYEGQCAISGCRVDTALDAAHLPGRSWRDGYNRSVDGILLRKDLHALYDAKLIRISKRGIVEVEPTAASDYQEYAGTLVRKPSPRY